MSDDNLHEFRVFISHKHQDKKLALAVHDVLFRDWLGERSEVFLSSRPGDGNPGNDLNDILQDALSKTDLFILLFTDADEDWSICMWELGVVTGSATKPTRVVTFYCGNTEPRVRISNMSVNARSRDEIANFTHKFHQEQDWLIRCEQTRAAEHKLLGYLKDRESDELTRRRDALAAAFEDELSPNPPQWVERLEYLKFALDRAHADEVVRLRREARGLNFISAEQPQYEALSEEERAYHSQLKQTYETLRADAKQLLRSELQLTSTLNDASRDALKRFGFQQPPAHKDLETLFMQWADDFRSHHQGQLDESDVLWQDELLRDLSRATEGQVSTPGQHTMPSTDGKGAEVLPVVVRTRLQSNGTVEFFVYFFRSPGNYADMKDDIALLEQTITEQSQLIAELQAEADDAT